MKLGSNLKVFLILLLLGAGFLGLYLYRPTLSSTFPTKEKNASPAAEFNPPSATNSANP